MAHRWRLSERTGRPSRRPHLQMEKMMNLMYAVGGLIAIGLLVYLMVALLKPEKF
jgi:K+-transporting ATPase KdpF subunit